MPQLELANGLICKYDEQDEEAVRRYHWSPRRGKRTFYAWTRPPELRRGPDHRPSVVMHRYLLHPPPEMTIDHINRNGLDNRRSNMRLATVQENCWNRKQANHSTGFIGVTWLKPQRIYQAKIRQDGKCYSLGCFKDPVKAAHAYDEACRRMRGEFAMVNFP